MPTFEVYTKGPRGRARSPRSLVSIHQRGRFGLNAAALAALGHPEAVTLLFDRAQRAIGLRSADRGTPNAYPVRPQSTGTTAIVCAQAFLRYYGIDHASAASYPAEPDDGVLVVKLLPAAAPREGTDGV